MKKTLILSLGLLAISGCTKVVEVPVAETQAPAPATPEAEPSYGDSTKKERLLVAVEQIREVPILLTGDEIWELAILMCDAVSTGMGVDGLIDMFVEASSGDDMVIQGFIAIAASAVAIVCPEYGYIFDESNIT